MRKTHINRRTNREPFKHVDNDIVEKTFLKATQHSYLGEIGLENVVCSQNVC